MFVGLVELELWPNLIWETTSAGIPLALINGRMSEHSHRGYRWVRFLMRPLLKRFQTLAVQTDQYAERLEDLGARPEQLTVTGSIKFDGVQIDRHAQQTAALRATFGIDETETVLIAGSTHEPEEAIALDAWQQLQQECPRLRLILVPRHQERFEDVAELVCSRGHALIRRSQCQPTPSTVVTRSSPSAAVCLLDTLGELSACWGLADVAFVGGSLTRRGGQNMIEPAACGIPVIVGPNTANFRDVVEGLDEAGGIRIITGAEALTGVIRGLLTDSRSAKQQGDAARDYVLAQQGAVGRTLAAIADHIPPASILPAREAA